MHKDELLQLHSLLCQVKRYFEDANLPLNGEFGEYESINVSPQHIHKSKTDHKKAVFLLGKGLSEVVMTDNPDNRSRLRDRFLRLAAGGSVVDPVERPRTLPSEPAAPTEHLPPFALAALRT